MSKVVVISGDSPNKNEWKAGVAISEKTGWLAGIISRYLYQMTRHEIICLYCDIANGNLIERALQTIGPEVVINAVGFTGGPGKNIDGCGESKAGQYAARMGNVVGVRNLGRVCADNNIYLIHLSTGDIFDGPGPSADGVWRETDIPSSPPVNYYARTKLAGENTLLKTYPSSTFIILRIRLPFDSTDHPKNMLSKLSKFRKVLDEENSFTSVDLLLLTLKVLLAEKPFVTGILHVANKGASTMYRIMQIYKQHISPEAIFDPISQEEMRQSGWIKEARPRSTLSVEKLEELFAKHGLSVTEVEAEILRCLMIIKAGIVDKQKWEYANPSGK